MTMVEQEHSYDVVTNLHMICSILVAKQDMNAIEPPRNRKITLIWYSSNKKSTSTSQWPWPVTIFSCKGNRRTLIANVDLNSPQRLYLWRRLSVCANNPSCKIDHHPSHYNNHYQCDNYFLAALLRFCSLSEASLALGGVIGTLCWTWGWETCNLVILRRRKCGGGYT